MFLSTVTKNDWQHPQLWLSRHQAICPAAALSSRADNSGTPILATTYLQICHTSWNTLETICEQRVLRIFHYSLQICKLLMNDQILICRQGAVPEGIHSFDKRLAVFSTGHSCRLIDCHCKTGNAIECLAMYWRSLGHYNLLAQTLIGESQVLPTCGDAPYKGLLEPSGQRVRWLQHVCSPEVEQTVFLIPCT